MPKHVRSIQTTKAISATPFVKIASYVLAALLCIGTLMYGLLHGLSAVCLGYLLILAVSKRMRVRGHGLSPALVVAIVILISMRYDGSRQSEGAIASVFTSAHKRSLVAWMQ